MVINKLLGLYQLRDMKLPQIEWKEYTGKESLDSSLLWTIRTAVFKGQDYSLPRAVGVTADAGNIALKKFYHQYEHQGIVIFYPFFYSEKSGHLFNHSK